MVARIVRVGNRINHSINTDIKNYSAWLWLQSLSKSIKRKYLIKSQIPQCEL